MSILRIPLLVSGPKGSNKFLVYVGSKCSPCNWKKFDRPTKINDIIGIKESEALKTRGSMDNLCQLDP
jgi:hypothetical protein